MPSRQLLIFAGAALWGLIALLQSCGNGPPDDAHLVLDSEGLLTSRERESLATYHRLLRTDHDVDYRVVVEGGAGDIDRYANDRYRDLHVGSLSAAGRGLLLVVDPMDDVVRLEVGGRLEDVFTDAFIAYVQHDQMVPFFRERRVADGILATTELLIAQLAAHSNPGQALGAADSFAAGGGASNAAELGAGRNESERRGPDVAAGATPAAAVAAYLDAMAARNANPRLGLYSERSRELLAGMPITPAQMDNVAREGRRCTWQPAFIGANDRAVVRAPPSERACAPYLLVLEDAQWRLDLVSVYESIRFGRGNAWHFHEGPPAPYAFAFADWSFDADGFPVAP